MDMHVCMCACVQVCLCVHASMPNSSFTNVKSKEFCVLFCCFLSVAGFNFTEVGCSGK